MVIFDAVNLVLRIYSEWHPVQALIADDTSKTSRMIRLAQGLEDHVHYKVATSKTLVGRLLKARVQKILLTIYPSVDKVESFTSQSSTACTAGETGIMV